MVRAAEVEDQLPNAARPRDRPCVGLGGGGPGEQFQDGRAVPRPTLQAGPQLIVDPLQFAHHALPGTFARP